MSLNRRTLIQGLGLGGLTGLCPPLARAHAAGPKRLVFLLTPNGSNTEVNWGNSDPANAMERAMRPFEPYRSKMTMLDVLRNSPGDRPYCPHLDHDGDYVALLTGRIPRLPANWSEMERSAADNDKRRQTFSAWRPLESTGRSADLALADAVGDRNPMVMGIREVKRSLLASWEDAGNPAAIRSDPFQIFRQFFPDRQLPGSLDGGDTTSSEVLAAMRRRSVLDGMREQVRFLQQHLNNDERVELCRRMDTIRDLESQMVALEQDALERDLTSCSVPDIPGQGDPGGDDRDYRTLVDVNLKLLSQIVACNLRRTITAQFDRHGSRVVFDWLHDPTDNESLSENHHAYTHRGDTTGARRREVIHLWYAQQIAGFIGELDSIREGDGTVLDNTLVVWLHEQGNGTTHSRQEHGVVLFGGYGGKVRTGQRIRIARNARTLNDLYLTLFDLVGSPRASFGDPQFCNGPISEVLSG
ncbi:MAG: DUF1552 domain-containing protein [Myxococcota bacterium]